MKYKIIFQKKSTFTFFFSCMKSTALSLKEHPEISCWDVSDAPGYTAINFPLDTAFRMDSRGFGYKASILFVLNFQFLFNFSFKWS